MAKCKYTMREHQVSNDNGFTWTPLEVIKGDLIEYGSSDCPDSGSEVTKLVDLENDYICEGNKKYKKQIVYVSYDDGVTWYVYFPTVYMKGEYIGVDESYCSNKYEGHYSSGNTIDCPRWWTYDPELGECVYVDPLKIVKCDSDGSSALTRTDTLYYVTGYTLFSATVGNCVTEISAGAFSGYTSLSSITLSDSITSIGSGAFQNCSNSALTTINIPSRVTNIGESAFTSCSSLTSIDIPSGVTTMGKYIFSYCPNLTKVKMYPTTPPTLGNNAFINSNNCLIYVPCDSLPAYKTASGWSTYSDRLRKYEECPFLGYKLTLKYDNAEDYKLECDSLDVLSSADTLVNTASRTHMTEATIGACVTSIGGSAFSGCTSLSRVLIPNTVTSIGDSAFSGDTSLSNVTIPDSVETIGNSVFYNCSSLSSATIGSGVTSIGERAFRTSGLKTIEIPDSVVSIGDYIFYECTSLTSCTIGSGVTSISNNAFYGCASLSSITIPNSVTSIGTNAFRHCTNLSAITIPNSVTRIGNGAFSGDTSLSVITIPDSVKTIGTYAFQICTGMTSCTIGSGITSIGDYAFSGCTNLPSITINATTPPSLGSNAFSNTNNCPIYVPCNSVEDYKSSYDWRTYYSRILPISSCTYNVKVSLYYVDHNKNVIINRPCDSSSTITTADTKSLYSISKLKQITIGDCVTDIYSSTCMNCTSLSSVTIGNNVETIGNYAFEGCSGLTSISIPNSVTSIGNGAFSACTSLSSATIGSGVTSIGERAFFDCKKILSINIPDSVTSIGQYAFARCSGSTTCTIGSGVTSIGANAFSGCSNLGEIIVKSPTPPTLPQINDVFSRTNNCPIYVPCGTLNEYTSDSNWSQYTNRLQEISPCDKQYSWNTVSGYACSGLTKMSREQLQVSTDGTTWENVIPEQYRPIPPIIQMQSIDCAKFYGEFKDGYSERLVECNNTTLSSTDVWNYYPYTSYSALTSATIGDCVTNISDNTFSGCTSLSSITIPNSVTSVGAAAFRYCESLSSVTIGSGVTSIGNGAFYHCDSLSSITIPDSVETIGDRVFGLCSLTSVTIGSGVTSIGDEAFRTSGNFQSIVIPNSVTNIGYGAFMDCQSLTSVTIGSGVTSIGERAFSGCTSLTSISIPSGVTSISTGVFYGCSGLTNVTISSGVTTIGDSAFTYCSGLTSLELSDNVTTIGGSAYNGCSSLSSVTIGSGVTSIGSMTFWNCPNLQTITIHTTTPPTLYDYTIIGSNYGYEINTQIYVPCESVAAYQSAWSYDANRIHGIPPCVTPPRLTATYSGGTEYVLDCTTATSITQNDTRYNSSAPTFTAMTSAVIGDCITTIENCTFCYGTSLSSVTIPNSVTLIGGSSFEGCRNLTSITIPSSVTVIYYSAFLNCSGLNSITIMAETPPTLSNGSYSFSDWFDNTNNCPIYVPSGSVDVYKTATNWTKYASRIQAIP